MTPAEFRTRRKELGLTQREMAEIMGTAPNTIARYERGELPLPQALATLAFEVIALRRLRDALAANPAPVRRAR